MENLVRGRRLADDRLLREAERGICRGCSLSPITGAFFLVELDERLEKAGLFFVRTMDDVMVLAPTRWKLRAAVKAVSEGLKGEDRTKEGPDPRLADARRGLLFQFKSASQSGGSSRTLRLAQGG